MFPCGREGDDKSEKPYEMKILKKMQENSLKDVFGFNPEMWKPIFQQYMMNQQNPNFSIYRKQMDDFNGEPCSIHILYMKSTHKAISRNYNAKQLELYCANRFYGPLVVALNLIKPPNYLVDFTLSHLKQLEKINMSMNAKSIKDDFVLQCLLDAPALNENLNVIFKTINVF